MIKELCDVMEKCYERGWITTRDGNASFRRKNSPFIHITPSGGRKNVLRVEDIIQMKMENGQLIVPAGTKPSGELEMHYALQKGASKTRSVLHVHPTHVVAAKDETELLKLQHYLNLQPIWKQFHFEKTKNDLRLK